MGIGAEIRKARNHRGMTLQQLAERAAITAAHLSKVENEKVSLSRRVLEQIAAGLGLEPESLLPDKRSEGAGQVVVDRRGRSSAERYLVESLARATYQDVIADGEPLSEAGWREPSQLAPESGIATAALLDGMVRLGLIEDEPSGRRFRLRAEANRQHDLVKACLDMQKYRDQFSSDVSRLKRASQEADRLLASLANVANELELRAALAVSGMSLVVRGARLEISTVELPAAQVVHAELETARVRCSPRIAFEALRRSLVGMSEDSTTTLELLRSRWDAIPACSKSNHLLCNSVAVDCQKPSKAEAFWIDKISALKLTNAPPSSLLAVYGSWIVWCYLERRQLLPATDEARTKLWAPEILQCLHRYVSEVPEDLAACARQHERFLQQFETLGGSCDGPDDDIVSDLLDFEPPCTGHANVLELFHFPWDDA
jgi:transcriptional regulator with XRE-family HTH domain